MTGVILMYHVVDEPRTPAERQWCCPPKAFEAQMRWLKENCRVVTLDAMVQSLRDGLALPPKTVCVTFDDGTRCIVDHALPVLQKCALPATAFVVAGLLGRNNDWLVRSGWSRRRLVDESDLRRLSAGGVEIGSHSMTHADLATLGADGLAREVRGSKEHLQAVLGAPVRHFAYPFGRLAEPAVAAVREAGYLSACTVEPGRNDKQVDPLLLRRVEVFGWDSMREFALKTRFAFDHVRPNAHFARGLAKRVLEWSGLRSPNRYSQ